MTSTTETTDLTTSTGDQLVQLAQNIRDWQAARPTKLSDEALIRRYPSLGSTKTYKRILSGDTDELRVDEWIGKYTSVLNQIDAEAADASKREDLYDDLSNARAVRSAVSRVVRSAGIERLVVIEGDTGCGKSSTLSMIAATYPSTKLDASVGWRSFASAMADLAIALGIADEVEKLPTSGAARLDLIVRYLGDSRRLILIDEAPHMTADSLNALKHLINRTQSCFVIAPQSTLWRKLAAASLQEVKQLLLNRLSGRVYLSGPTKDDVATFLFKRAHGLELSNAAAEEIARTAGRYGNYAFLRRLAAELLETKKDIAESTALEITKTLARDLA
jgi:energy-coupling factor transporter ATP-binding protein EcfA2